MTDTVQQTNRISGLEVAKYYIKSELGHILPGLNSKIARSDDIEKLSEEEVWALCEALSIFYRLNAVWWVVANPEFSWYKTEVPIENIRLTGMGDTEISRLIHSDQIGRDPAKLREHLKNYYANLGAATADIYNVRPSNKPIELTDILLIEQEGQLNLLDGSHRFIEQLLQGKAEIRAYVARSDLPEGKVEPVVGDGIYRVFVQVLESLESLHEKTVVRDMAQLLKRYSVNPNPLQKFPALRERQETDNG